MPRNDIDFWNKMAIAWIAARTLPNVSNITGKARILYSALPLLIKAPKTLNRQKAQILSTNPVFMKLIKE